MPCKGICIRYKSSGRYATGNKRCNQCNLFIKWNGLLCPCCGYKLRTRPRHSKFKEKLREQKQIAEAKEAKILYRSPKA
jgi:predicted amidophosphoribosyltransferase